MNKFDTAFNYVIDNEGAKFVDNPSDRGGATKFGISFRFIISLSDDDLLPSPNVSFFMKKKDIDVLFYIKTMTIEQVNCIYQKYFWLPIYEQIENQDICNYIFDITVQHGKEKAAELVQRALNSCSGGQYLKIDGIFGNKTLEDLNCYYDDIDNRYMKKVLKTALTAVRESLFRCIVAHDKSQEKFLEGWLKRCYK